MSFDEPTDKDSYVNKRIELSGSLMAELFRELYRDFQNDTRRATEKLYEYNKSAYSNSNFMNIFNDPDNINNIFNKNIIHQGMINGFRGKWGKKKDPSKQGIVQDLNRLSNLGTLSHLRRTNVPIERSSKLVAPHRLHSSQWGIICPTETPDGGNCGLLKQ